MQKSIKKGQEHKKECGKIKKRMCENKKKMLRNYAV